MNSNDFSKWPNPEEPHVRRESAPTPMPEGYYSNPAGVNHPAYASAQVAYPIPPQVYYQRAADYHRPMYPTQRIRHEYSYYYQRYNPHPSLAIRLLYFLFIGCWLGTTWLAIAITMCITLIGLPLGIAMLYATPRLYFL
ncbi:hypothetical protein [Candidatus Chlorohelix sp.]|uniref:hypothetical protein n=1 Tax=Candidatus Chlorohelix sp. TaxID=3139201 RepID=UPI0030373033